MPAVGEHIGTAWVNILASARGIGRDIKKQLDRELDGPARDAGERSGDKAVEGFTSKFGKSLTEKSKGLGSGLTKALKKEFELSAVTIATGFSAQLIGSVAAGLVSGADKILHGLGAVAALLPSIIGAGVLGFATLKIAVQGVGDALKEGLAGDTEKFEEALKGLAPAAQAFAREVVDLKGGFDGLKGVVQENLFAPLVGSIRPLAERYFPILQDHMGGIASAFGGAGRHLVDFLENEETAAALNVAFGHMATAVKDVVKAGANLAIAFFPLIEVGSTFLPNLTAGFGNATLRLQDFLQRAQATGQLKDFIQGGLDKLKELWETIQQVGRILGDIGTIASTAFGDIGGVFAGLGIQTGGLLDTIEGLTSKAADFITTAEGSSAVGTVFETLGAVIAGAFGWLQRLAELIGRVFGPILPQIAELFEAVANLKVAFIDALEPALVSVGGVLGRNVLPALTKLAEVLARNRPLLQGIGIAIVTLLIPATVAWAISTLAAIGPWLLLGAAIAGFAALVIIHFDTIRNVVTGVFSWIADNWPKLIGIFTGPIGIVVGLIITHFDTIRDAIVGVFNWVAGNWGTIYDILTAPVDFAVSTIKSILGTVVSFVAGLGSSIADAASGMWNGISDAFRSMINTVIGWWNGISFKLPTIEIPGFDPPGPGSFGGFSIGGQTFSTPDIGYLHTGGIFHAPGGSSEGLALLQDGEGVFTPDQMAALAQHSASGGSGHVVIDLTGGDSEFLRWLSKRIREKNGGDVQAALGGRR